MDCRTYKEMLDSYLCDELAVETNHQIQRHAEGCPGCRAEMGARRELRRVLKIACGKEQISVAARARICDKLRAGYAGEQRNSFWQRLVGWGSLQGLPVLAVPALGVLAVVGLLGVVWLAWPNRPQPPELSNALLDEAAGDHRVCAGKFAQAVAPTELPDSIKQMDQAYAGLEPVVLPAPAEVVLHSAHVCNFGGRQFVHLVYTRDSRLLSLLVTARDGRAIDLQRLPSDDGSAALVQRAARDQFALGAYQTPRHVVLAVSESQDQQMAEQSLASPVADYLRRAERKTVIGRLSLDGLSMDGLLLGLAMNK